MKIYVVSTNPETGEYVAFDAEQPQRRAVGYLRESAIARFVEEYGRAFGLQIVDIEPHP